MTMYTLAFSSCPNDTFVFHAMTHGLIDTGGSTFTTHIRDVEELNGAAFMGTYDITKLSYHAYLLLRKSYTLLRSGSALGFGCGPLLVARNAPRDLTRATVAIPGTFTTAYMLLRLWNPDIVNIAVARFDEILEGVASGRFDAGLIIHEGRFVYPRYNLEKIIDLGEWWESETGLPIPLGCIAMRSAPEFSDALPAISAAIRRSVEYAFDNPEQSSDYVREHAREMDDNVIRQHIGLYVNNFTRDLGDTGEKAVKALEDMALCRGILRA